MIIFQYIYSFLNEYFTWDFGPEANALLLTLWRKLGSFISSL